MGCAGRGGKNFKEEVNGMSSVLELVGLLRSTGWRLVEVGLPFGTGLPMEDFLTGGVEGLKEGLPVEDFLTGGVEGDFLTGDVWSHSLDWRGSALSLRRTWGPKGDLLTDREVTSGE